MKVSRRTSGGGLSALASRLERVAAGEHRPAALEAAVVPLARVVDAETAKHVDTGRMHGTAQVVVTADGLEVQGPRYMPFVRGLEINTPQTRAQVVEVYTGELRKELVG